MIFHVKNNFFTKKCIKEKSFVRFIFEFPGQKVTSRIYRICYKQTSQLHSKVIVSGLDVGTDLVPSISLFCCFYFPFRFGVYILF